MTLRCNDRAGGEEAPPRRALLLARCARTLSYPLRRPGRTAAVVALVALIGLGVGVAVLYAWGRCQLETARLAVERYHNRAAQESLQAYLRVWPRDPTTLLLAARTARRMGAFSEAEGFLDRFESVRGKNDDEGVLERALLQAQRGRVDAVREFCLARVRDGDPAAPLVLEAQAAGLMRVYRSAEAEEVLATWLKLRPDDCQALLFQGILLDLRLHRPEAADKFRRVVEIDPDNEEARLRLAALLLEDHEAKEALNHLEYLRSILPDDPRILVPLARCRVDLGQPEEAKKVLDGVLARHPHFADALAERGELAMQDGDLGRAEAWLREAVARDPGVRDAHYHLYLCLSARGKEAEAKEEDERLHSLENDLREVEELIDHEMPASPYDPKLHYKAGMIALRSGAAGEGVRWLESALDLDPHYAPAHQALAAYYDQVGDHARAARHRAQAAGGDPENNAAGKP